MDTQCQESYHNIIELSKWKEVETVLGAHPSVVRAAGQVVAVSVNADLIDGGRVLQENTTSYINLLQSTSNL